MILEAAAKPTHQTKVALMPKVNTTVSNAHERT
jgi:hypothetical protein